MRKNLIYFGVLVLLLSITYFFEEIKKPKALMQRKLEKSLLKTDLDIDRITLKNLILLKGADNSWNAEQSLLSVNQDQLMAFIKVMKGIYIDSEIESTKWEDFTKFQNIPFSLNIGSQEFEYILGDVSPATGAFYIISKNTSNVFICYDESSFGEIYQNQKDLDLKKYLRLKSFLENKNNLFFINNILQFIDLEKVQKISIDSKRNAKFDLNLVGNKTTPLPPKGMTNYNLKSALKHYFNNASISEVISFGHNILSNPVSSVIFDFEAKQIKMTLYAGLNGEFGRYLKISDINSIFKLNVKSPNPFYINIQDFWDKRHLIAKMNLKDLKRLDFVIKKESKDYKFYVEDFDSFEIKSEDSSVLEVSTTHMNMLFNLLFNLVDFKNPKYILETQPDNEQNDFISISVLGETYRVGINKQYIEVYELSSDITYFYEYNTEIIKKGFFSNIFTVK